MADNTNSQATSGIGVFSLLGVAFIVLKLCHVINWSWTWVLAPFWIPGAIFFVVAGVCLLVFGGLKLMGK